MSSPHGHSGALIGRAARLLPALLVAVPTLARAQYSVAQVQPLAFGYLTQGITEVVAATDAFRRGVVTVDGSGQAYVRVVLPVALTSPQGASIPLQFLTGDVTAQESGRPAAAFDPATSTRVNLGKGTASLFIGGRAVPAANQRAGAYTATMTVIVSSTKF
jgi:spore coat protein U-like protein